MDSRYTFLENSDLVQRLSEERLFFGLLGKILYLIPEKEWFKMLLSEKVFEDVPFSSPREEFQTGLALLKDWDRESGPERSDETFTALQLDYARLFVGGSHVLAPLWESVYFNKERLVFQRETLQVRGWYRKYDLQSEKLYHEPDDHLGLELSFLSHLAKLSLEAFEQCDQARLDGLLRDQGAFLSEHPLRWAPAWCDLVNQHARTSFYRGVAWIVIGALKEAAHMLQNQALQFS